MKSRNTLPNFEHHKLRAFSNRCVGERSQWANHCGDAETVLSRFILGMQTHA
jgi:hypothetical protein